MLTDVPGVKVGHWTDTDAGTGCTAIILPPGTRGGVDVRGGGPASRETDLLRPEATVPVVSAIVLSGGSAFGLDTAGGVMAWCEEQGLGVDTGIALVPIVPAASLFDLGITGTARRPGAAEGRLAAEAAGDGPHAVGSVGAGTGATVGKCHGRDHWCKGGLGAASVRLASGATVAAMAVVNAFGDVLDESVAVPALSGHLAEEDGIVEALTDGGVVKVHALIHVGGAAGQGATSGEPVEDEGDHDDHQQEAEDQTVVLAGGVLEPGNHSGNLP